MGASIIARGRSGGRAHATIDSLGSASPGRGGVVVRGPASHRVPWTSTREAASPIVAMSSNPLGAAVPRAATIRLRWRDHLDRAALGAVGGFQLVPDPPEAPRSRRRLPHVVGRTCGCCIASGLPTRCGYRAPGATGARCDRPSRSTGGFHGWRGSIGRSHSWQRQPSRSKTRPVGPDGPPPPGRPVGRQRPAAAGRLWSPG